MNRGFLLDPSSISSQLRPAGGHAARRLHENANLVSKTPTPTFDDLVTWISPYLLYNRTISAGRLP